MKRTYQPSNRKRKTNTILRKANANGRVSHHAAKGRRNDHGRILRNQK